MPWANQGKKTDKQPIKQMIWALFKQRWRGVADCKGKDFPLCVWDDFSYDRLLPMYLPQRWR